MEKKSVKAYANPGSGKCMVRILDFYKSKVPSEPKAKGPTLDNIHVAVPVEPYCS